jgi:phosphatidylinositol kinase/protein kinase (PI-3  family)
MVVLMGGRASEGYALFAQLTIKAFLAIRPHASQIVEAIHLMLGTGLPSFKGEPTIRRLRERFALHLNERQAAEWMNSIIRNAYENVRSTIYDEFQRVRCLGFWSQCQWSHYRSLHRSKMVCVLIRFPNSTATQHPTMLGIPYA